MVPAGDALGLSPSPRKSGEQQASQNADNGDNHQQFDQTETPGMKWTWNETSIAPYGAQFADFAVTACFLCQGVGLRETENSAGALFAGFGAPSSCRSFRSR